MSEHKKTLDELIELVISQGASDLHLAEGRIPTVRINGDLNPIKKYNPFTKEQVKEILYEMLLESFRTTFEKRQQVDFSYATKDGTRFRGNGFIQQGKIGIVMRMIPNVIRHISELNLPPILESFSRKKQGFFLVVGPVGQGKSTTLASMIDLINEERPEHIITIEDPVEYIYKPKRSMIDQREIGIDTPSFYDALVGAFRQDVDVILVGEMRDKDTMSAAVTAAETGHLVFSTLHTNTASQTIDRIIDSFPSDQQAQIRLQLSSSLLGIFSQRLVPRISGGLIPAYELLINNNAVANLIREKRTHEIDTVIETGSESGMIDMNRTLADLVRRGEISPENAFLNSTRPKVLERMI
ncbi:MAG TPA: type IV pilus twitching motility protein PilT [Candidatus Paceibacterota bacterium]|nr:type IV pilus twitching motility protein PilT [Candidatus Paceibacterota bacterium]HMP19167.1 type IV pilus twitching motility protein PilT [Candidatus Paceibacterota bacterium]HMP85218.1 type IV pilus twitching motility protein PilT [Candidatus Paceibacterota bacterium]